MNYITEEEESLAQSNLFNSGKKKSINYFGYSNSKGNLKTPCKNNSKKEFSTGCSTGNKENKRDRLSISKPIFCFSKKKQGKKP